MRLRPHRLGQVVDEERDPLQRGAREVRRVDVVPEGIPEALRARWFFGDGPLALVACFDAGGRVAELFRRVGAAAFKGLGGVVVWELCAETGGPAALAEALGPGWLRGADAAP